MNHTLIVRFSGNPREDIRRLAERAVEVLDGCLISVAEEGRNLPDAACAVEVRVRVTADLPLAGEFAIVQALEDSLAPSGLELLTAERRPDAAFAELPRAV